MYEHSIPATFVRSELINSDYREKTVKMILEKAGEVTLILRIEDKKLNDCGLKKCMPSEWSFGSDSQIRYKKAAVEISKERLKVKGSIQRYLRSIYWI